MKYIRVFCEIHKGILHAMLEGEKLHNADHLYKCIATKYTSSSQHLIHLKFNVHISAYKPFCGFSQTHL